MNVDYSTSSNVIHRELKWLTVKQRLMYHTCILMFKVLNNDAPGYLNVFSHVQSRYALRSTAANNLNVPKPNLECFRRSFSFSGASAWNQLPTNVKSAQSLLDFKGLLWNYLTTNYV